MHGVHIIHAHIFSRIKLTRLLEAMAKCSLVIGRSHCIALFSEDSVKCNLASRMTKLLEVPISQEDKLSYLVSQSCKVKFLTVENKLDSMHTHAQVH